MRLILIGALCISTAAHAQSALDTLEHAQQLAPTIRMQSDRPAADQKGVGQSEQRRRYNSVAMTQTDPNGNIKAQGTTLWLHHTAGWYWDFFSYSSDSWAWVTDAQTGGNPVSVDSIEAILTHNSCYGNQSAKSANTNVTHAYVRVTGIAVCKSDICAYACAEKAGYTRWCTAQWCG